MFDLTWEKVLAGLMAFACGVVIPRAYKAAKNVGKTKQQMLEDELSTALIKLERAKATADTKDDEAAQADVERLKTAIKHLRLARAALEGAGE